MVFLEHPHKTYFTEDKEIDNLFLILFLLLLLLSLAD